MCTLALFLDQSAIRPLVIAANRDEFLGRPSTDPIAIDGEPCWVVAGVDLVAGGTWLGLNQRGMVAGILNRRTNAGPDPTLASRGALCLEMLRCHTLGEARTLLSQRHGESYNPFNLLVATSGEAFVAQNRPGRIDVTDLPPGLHLLSNLDLNDPTCPRIAKSHRLFQAALPQLNDPDRRGLIAHLRAVLSDHSTPLDPRGDGAIENLCVHRGEYGTRSSSVVLFENGRPTFLHSPGPPCENDYQVVTLPPP